MGAFVDGLKLFSFVVALSVTLGTPAQAQLATSAEDFIPELNATLDGADGGVAINATQDECTDGLCPFAGFSGHIQGTLAINADGSLGVVAIVQPLSSGQIGLFFATVAASLNTLAPNASDESRAAAMSDMIQHVVSQEDAAFTTTVGKVMMAVEVAAPTHFMTTVSSAE